MTIPIKKYDNKTGTKIKASATMPIQTRLLKTIVIKSCFISLKP
jgi:hypothetical protein